MFEYQLNLKSYCIQDTQMAIRITYNGYTLINIQDGVFGTISLETVLIPVHITF